MDVVEAQWECPAETRHAWRWAQGIKGTGQAVESIAFSVQKLSCDFHL